MYCGWSEYVLVKLFASEHYGSNNDKCQMKPKTNVKIISKSM